MVIITSLDLLLKDLKAHPANLEADVTTFCIWTLKDKSLLISTPRSLRCSFSSIMVPSGAMYPMSGVLLFPGKKRKHSNLSALNFILTSSAHLYTASRSSWRALQSTSGSLIPLLIRVSSAKDDTDDDVDTVDDDVDVDVEDDEDDEDDEDVPLAISAM